MTTPHRSPTRPPRIRPGQLIPSLTTGQAWALMGTCCFFGFIFWSCQIGYAIQRGEVAKNRKVIAESRAQYEADKTVPVTAPQQAPVGRTPTAAERNMMGMWRGTFSDGNTGYYLFIWVENGADSYLGSGDNIDGSLLPRWRERFADGWTMPHDEWVEWIYGGTFGARALVENGANDATLVRTCNRGTICNKKRFDAAYLHGWNDKDHAEIMVFSGQNAVIESRSIAMFTHSRERWK